MIFFVDLLLNVNLDFSPLIVVIILNTFLIELNSLEMSSNCKNCPGYIPLNVSEYTSFTIIENSLNDAPTPESVTKPTTFNTSPTLYFIPEFITLTFSIIESVSTANDTVAFSPIPELPDA